MTPTNPDRRDNGTRYPAGGHDADAGERTLASRTSDQVHEILRATESQADELRRQVESWAVTRVRDIEEEALRYLDDAKVRSDALVSARVAPIVSLSTVVEECAERVISLLDETERIKAELRDVVQNLRDGLHAGSAPPAGTPRPVAVAAPQAVPPPPADPPRAAPPRFAPPSAAPPRAASPRPAPRAAPPQAASPPAPPPFRTIEENLPPASEAPLPRRGDEGVHILALQLAIQGSTRNDVERKIRDEFDVRHPQEILDEVFGAGTPGSHRIAWNAN